MGFEYTLDDFQHGTGPYEEVFRYIGDPFQHKTVLDDMADRAKAVGFKGFKKKYEFYCTSERRKKRNSVVPVGQATDFSDQPIELDCGEWTATDSGICRDSGFGLECACPHPVMPVQRFVNIDTLEEKLELAYRRGQVWRKAIVPKTTLASASKVTDLAGIGVAVTSQTAKLFVQYISDMECLNYDLIPERKSIGRLGYIEGSGFSPYVEDLTFDGDANFAPLFKAVQSHGSEEEWLNMAKEVRNESVTAKILLAASFASPVLNVLGALPFFVHLWGSDSGTGKTVALMVAASVWGNPALGSYVKTFDSTVVGLEKTAAFLNHLPLCIDELQLAKDSRGRTQFDVYKLAQGVGRTRGNRGGGVDMTPTWKLCVLTTGESPLTGDSCGAGAVNRVVDIECKSSAKVISDGIRISGLAKRNYGFAGRKFVKRLYEDREELERISERYHELVRTFSDSDTTEKQAMAAAAIVVADELACDWIFGGEEKPISTEEIAGFLASKAAVSVGDRAYRYICDWVSQNASKLVQESDVVEVYGALDTEAGYAYIIRTIFRRILTDAGFSERAIVSYLKTNGLLKCRAKNNTQSKRINHVPTECFCVKLPVDETEIETEEFIP